MRESFDENIISLLKKYSLEFLYEGEIRFGPRYYKIKLNGSEIQNRVFGFKFKWQHNDKFLALQEWLTTNEKDGPITALTIINLEDKLIARISRVYGGFMEPIIFTENKVIYEKQFYEKGEKVVEYEINLSEIQNWKPISFK